MYIPGIPVFFLAPSNALNYASTNAFANNVTASISDVSLQLLEAVFAHYKNAEQYMSILTVKDSKLGLLHDMISRIIISWLTVTLAAAALPSSTIDTLPDVARGEDILFYI